MSERRTEVHRVLVAGIGNIFQGDDAFGVEVARILASRELPPEVQVEDFGIRSYDLAFALTAGYDVVILVDATQRGDRPGTLYLLELDLDELNDLDLGPLDPHQLNALSVLQMAQAFGVVSAKLYLVGCEPASLEPDGGSLGLSESVRTAVPEASKMIEALVRDRLCPELKTLVGLTPN